VDKAISYAVAGTHCASAGPSIKFID